MYKIRHHWVAAVCAIGLTQLAASTLPVHAQAYSSRPLRFIVPFPPGLDASSEQGSRLRNANVRESAATAVFVAQSAVTSSQYPSRPIRFIVPFPPGGSTDIYARIIGPRLADALRQQVVIDNRPGAGGALSADLAAKSPSDGYTIWLGQTNNLAIGPAMIDLRGGRVTYLATSLASAAQSVKDGKIKAIATTGAKRARLMPDVPTVSESGVPGFEVDSWHGMLAPAKVPREIIARLNRDIVLILDKPDVREALLSEGGEITPGTPDEFAVFLKDEVLKWAKVVKQAGIMAE